MNIQLTAAGIALLEANTGPVVVTSYKLGGAYNYVPDPDDTDIHGTLVYSGVPSDPIAADGNTLLYSIFLDYELGPFDFGEIGLFVGSTLFALGASNTLIHKEAGPDPRVDNSLRLDLYVPVQGSNYDVWLNPSVSDNRFRMAVIQSPDQLPLPQDATPNAYVLQGDSNSVESTIAYTDRGSTWAFTEYDVIGGATITAASTLSVTIARSQHLPAMDPAYTGESVMQFTSGSMRGVCRNIVSIIDSGLNATINFGTALTKLPAVGTQIRVYSRKVHLPYVLPMASPTVMGGVKVGQGLSISGEGAIAAAVRTVAGRTGDISLTYADIDGTPPAYVLPKATDATLGGVVIGSTMTIDVNGIINAKTATTTNAGVVRVGGGLSVDVNGLISVNTVVNAKRYGAKGDDATNDTGFIQAALDHLESIGGGALYIPEGVYHIMAPESNYLWLTVSSNRRNYAGLLIPSNVCVFGDGSKTVLKLIGTPPSPGTTDGRGDYSTTHIMVNKGAPGLPKTIVNRNIVVWGIKFDGNNIQQSGEGVSFCGTQNFLITRCEFTQSYYETNYIVFSRGGLITDCRMYTNGIYQIDGGGPMVDTSTDVAILNNIIIDSGYYAILLIDAWNCRADGNFIFKDQYENGAGYQAIRVAGCNMTSVSGNMISDSAYSAIWIHNGYCNTLRDNTVIHAGYGAGAGSNIHGISVDFSDTRRGGRHVIDGNKVFYSNGVGIALLEGIPYGVANEDGKNAGSTVSNNICLYNRRDGIAIYGSYHRIIGNTVESNGISITDGIPGNGYNGITLNGATHCTVIGNSCMDVLQPTPVPLNLDAAAGTDFGTPYSITHTARTQNYGIVEYPGGITGNIPADYNTIKDNNVLGNLANPTGNGGYHAYDNGTIVCGVHSLVKDNQGAVDVNAVTQPTETAYWWEHWWYIGQEEPTIAPLPNAGTTGVQVLTALSVLDGAAPPGGWDYTVELLDYSNPGSPVVLWTAAHQTANLAQRSSIYLPAASAYALRLTNHSATPLGMTSNLLYVPTNTVLISD